MGRAMRVISPLEGGVVHLFVVCGHRGSEEDAEKLSLTDKLLQAVLAEPQIVCVWGSRCLLWVRSMLILGSFLAWPKALLLVSLWVLLWLILLVLGRIPMLLAGLDWNEGSGTWRDVVAAYLMRWLLRLPVRSLTGGSLPIFLFWRGLASASGSLRFLALVLPSPSGLHVGLILLIGLLPPPPRLFRRFGIFIGRILQWFPRRSFRRSGLRMTGGVWMDAWSAGAESCRAGGLASPGCHAYLGRGRLRTRRRRLGGKAVGGRGSSRLYRASGSDDFDAASAQFFVN